MGFKTLVLLLIISVFSVSCSSIDFTTQNEINRDYSMFNYLCERHNSKIILLNGEEIETEYVFIKNDSLFYCNEADTISFPIDIVEKVRTKQWIGAFATGFLLGGGVTLGSGYLIMLASGGGLGGALVGAGGGLIIGTSALILGIIYGGETEYIFNNKANYEQIEYYKNYKKRKAELE